MDPNTSTNAVVDSSEEANGIVKVHNHSFYNHVDKNAYTHTSTNDANQVDWEGSLHALLGGPHQQNSISTMDAFDTQSVQTNKSVVTVNSGDTNQSAKSRLRVHVHLPQTSTEQSLFKSRVTDPCEGSLSDDPSDGNHKKRRTGYGNSSGTAPTGYLPIFTADKEFACPKCNMGDGYLIRPYTKKGDAQADRTVSAGTPKSNQQLKPPMSFKTTTCFDRHMRAAHRRDFKSSDSPEYICRYCPCEFLTGYFTCGVRFNEKNFNGLLQHLRDHHADPSMQDKNNPHDHWCASSDESLQLQPLREFANWEDAFATA